MIMASKVYLCDMCQSKPCRRGERDDFPPYCPGRQLSKEEALGLYDQQDLDSLREAAWVEANGYCHWTRCEEIMAYAVRCGYNHLGLAFCAGLSKEAAAYAGILRVNGFLVSPLCCKNCSVPKQEAGIPPSSMVKGGAEYEASCNPVGQAHFLMEAGCQLAIILGLCVGHDSLFIKHFDGPVTVLSAKDRVTGNAPLAPLYTADSYYKRLRSFVKEQLSENK